MSNGVPSMFVNLKIVKVLLDQNSISVEKARKNLMVCDYH
jgi:hypothetical protein